MSVPPHPAPAAPRTVRPAGPADAAGIAEVHVAAWRETYPGIVPRSCLDALSVAERRAFWAERLGRAGGPGGAVFVAADDLGSIVGFGSCGMQRGAEMAWDGEIHALYILRNHQRVGLGRRLMTLMAWAMCESGCRSANAWVIDANEPAARFYGRLGAARDVTRSLVIDGRRLTETSHVWRDLEASFPRTAREEARDA